MKYKFQILRCKAARALDLGGPKILLEMPAVGVATIRRAERGRARRHDDG